MEELIHQGGFGRTLRSAREAAGIGIHELSEVTKVQGRYIEALEEENWARVPGGVIGRGFIRIISKQIGANTDRLIELYSESRGEETPGVLCQPPDTVFKTGHMVPKFNSRLLVALLIVAVAIIVLGYAGWKVRESFSPKPKPVAVAATHHLEVKALANTWVKVKAKDEVEDKRLLEMGETLAFDHEELELDVPDGSQVQLIWDGTPLKPVGAVGEAVKVKLPRDLETLKP